MEFTVSGIFHDWHLIWFLKMQYFIAFSLLVTLMMMILRPTENLETLQHVEELLQDTQRKSIAETPNDKVVEVYDEEKAPDFAGSEQAKKENLDADTD